jgi:WW domain-containing oxidoreductase
LVQTLLPLLQRTPDSRLVLQSSDLHRGISDVKFESEEELNKDIGPTMLYNRTKLAQILYIRALADRKQKGQLGFNADMSVGPFMNATHPGGVSTDQQEQAVEAYGLLGRIGVAATRPFLKDPVDAGCRPALFAATSPDIVKDTVQGQYVSSNRTWLTRIFTHENLDCTGPQSHRSIRRGLRPATRREPVATD